MAPAGIDAEALVTDEDTDGLGEGFHSRGDAC